MNSRFRFSIHGSTFITLLLMLTQSAFAEEEVDLATAETPSELPGQVISDADLRKAPYERLSPHWGFQLGLAPRVFSNGNALPTESNKGASSVQLSAEWIPLATDRYGLVGIGGVGSFYGYTSTPSKTSNQPSGFPGWSAGGFVRYQLKYLHNQWVVPNVGYRAEYFNFRNNLNQFNSMIATGPALGAWIFLNVLDPWTTADLYADSGITRSYLTAEAVSLRGSNSGFSLSGTTYLFGLRFEM